MPERKRTLRRKLTIIVVVLIAMTAFFVFYRPGPLPPNPAVQEIVKTQVTSPPEPSTEEKLKGIVDHLSVTIGPRNLGHYDALNQSADWIEGEFKKYGYTVQRQTFQVRERDCFNLIAELPGQSAADEIIIVGAHYDSAYETPGANDNGSGVAAMLVIAEKLAQFKPQRTLRFVAFTNEEPPFFQREGQMGSLVYARSCRAANDKIVAVLALETMGYFTDEPNSQKYPAVIAPFYPSVGNFLGFVANMSSKPLAQDVEAKFKEVCPVPSLSAGLPDFIKGVGWSDHWSFWQAGYQGIMITDTALFRYEHYHEPTDTPDKLNFPVFAKCVDGLAKVVEHLTDKPE